MIRLPKPQVDIDAYVAQVVKEREGGVNKAFFAGLQDKWAERCHTYDAQRGDGASLPVWPEAIAQKVRFKTLYASPKPGSAQEPVLHALRDRALQLCPVCGEPGTPNTLDHFLPQDSYPDFAILPLNLVPACDICQGHKRANVVGPDGRLFLHPYYDDCLEGQVARLQFHPPYETPAVALVCHPDLSEDWAPVVSRHLAELQLHARLERFFNSEYLRVLKLVKRARAVGWSVPEELHRFKANAADRALNAWDHLLWEGVLADAGLMDYLEHGALPEHV